MQRGRAVPGVRNGSPGNNLPGTVPKVVRRCPASVFGVPSEDEDRQRNHRHQQGTNSEKVLRWVREERRTEPVCAGVQSGMSAWKVYSAGNVPLRSGLRWKVMQYKLPTESLGLGLFAGVQVPQQLDL